MRMLVLLAALLGISFSATASPEGPVWFWFADCGGPTMKLEVQLDQKTIFASSFPMCKALRDSAGSVGQGKRLEFLFTPKRALVWSGYKDETESSAPNQLIEGNIWLAGADPSVAILGVSFNTPNSILMNTVHIAYPEKEAKSEIAPGLVVITSTLVRK